MPKRITYLGGTPVNDLPPKNIGGISANQLRNPKTGDVLTFGLNQPVFINDGAPNLDPVEKQFFTDCIAFAGANPDQFKVEDYDTSAIPDGGPSLAEQKTSAATSGVPPMPDAIEPPPPPDPGAGAAERRSGGRHHHKREED